MKTTDWNTVTPSFRIRVTYGLRKIGNQPPYFSITAESERRSSGKGRWMEDSSGQQHGQIRKYFKKLAPLTKWHLVSVEDGPMHYEANALFWAKEGEVKNFAETVVFGAVPNDQPSFDTVKDTDELKQWLRARLPALMSAFRREMAAHDIKF